MIISSGVAFFGAGQETQSALVCGLMNLNENSDLTQPRHNLCRVDDSDSGLSGSIGDQCEKGW